MSRNLAPTYESELDAVHAEPVVLCRFDFTTPVYVHSGIGSIDWDSKTWLGVGDFGGVDGLEENQIVSPSPIRFALSGIDDTYIAEALNAGNFGDQIIVYYGFRGADRQLVTDPIILGRASFEFASFELGGEENRIVITGQHELAFLNQAEGSRYTDEDQQRKFPGDTGFAFVADALESVLKWGGQRLGGSKNFHDLSDRDRIESESF